MLCLEDRKEGEKDLAGSHEPDQLSPAAGESVPQIGRKHFKCKTHIHTEHVFHPQVCSGDISDHNK